ncbi:MAG: ATP-dependent Clp protease adaptor ClpS [Candidatus Delongbacteria bacterium]|nr:ATP-dependent Clp protease adaptor ClpS [Candidatus Delongbacteria bacterium]MBN2835343.1 ATP-dependent Clp protease adaptor ClpS [Candidatus Delongbacteria bacterium]
MSKRYGYQTEENDQTKDFIYEPEEYKVLLLNDDYTTMEFVIQILMELFHKSIEEANAIMMSVHKNGSGICGIYVKEIAETKVMQVKSLAKTNGFPLRATMERV